MLQFIHRRVWQHAWSPCRASAARTITSFQHEQQDEYSPPTEISTADTLAIMNMVHRVKSLGYFCANLDPLRDGDYSWWAHRHAPQLVCLFGENRRTWNLAAFGLGHLDLDAKLYMPNLMQQDKDEWTLREILHTMTSRYCGTVGLEVAHVLDPDRRSWLRKQLTTYEGHFSDAGKKRLLRQLMEAHYLEGLLHSKFPSSKRFGAEGCEALLPALHNCLARAARLGVTHVEMGMSHRARLSVLGNVFQKPVGALCTQFLPESDDGESGYTGDVLYHLGTEGRLDYSGLEEEEQYLIDITLAPNPSHLEAVNPVVMGRTRQVQHTLEDKDRTRVLGILVHGDAAFIGQGITAETLELSDLPDFRTGGTIHIVINNQIGFTTNPQIARSSPFPTDMALVVRAPVLHVNGDDVEAVARSMQVAVEYRQKYGSDIVVDIVCYRRRGHNEQDNPAVTQPLTTKIIQSHPTVYEKYANQLKADGVITKEDLERDEKRYEHLLMQEMEATLGGEYLMMEPDRWRSREWKEQQQELIKDTRPTGVPMELLQHIARRLSRLPEDFNAHPDVLKVMNKRADMAEGKTGVNMAFAEALAFGTLLRRYNCEDWEEDMGVYTGADKTYFQQPENEWTHVRLSGQDVERGTFNQRHAVLWDQTTSQPYVPLNNIVREVASPSSRWSDGVTGEIKQATLQAPAIELGEQQIFRVCNSSLSEAAVLGFEYGYSIVDQTLNKSRLVLWEAQFGDFANGAQVLIDNFIASAEAKWSVHSNLVLLLPHGHEGQGPDHSSARVERFLQLVKEPVLGGLKIEASSKDVLLKAFEEADHDKDGRLSTELMEQVLMDLVQKHTKMRDSLLPFGAGWNRESLGIIRTQISKTYKGPNGESMLHDSTGWLVFCSAFLRRIAERDINMFVVNPTTPANYFHMLRRQVHLSYFKPLVVMSPKFLHHHSPCQSQLDEFAVGSYVRRLIVDGSPGDSMQHALVQPSKVRRVVFCSGKISYELMRARKTAKVDDVVIARLEQIAPFPFDRVAQVMMQFPAAEIVWAQEEPKNQGCWHFVNERVSSVCAELHMPGEFQGHNFGRKMRYIGREEGSSSAPGSMQQHRVQQTELLKECMR